MPRTLRPGSGQGLKAAQVTNIPAQWDANWFRSFITTHMNPYALQGIQGQAGATPPKMTVTVNGPLQGTLVLTGTAGARSGWVTTQFVHLPDAVAFNVEANGGVVDLLIGANAGWNGYVMRFDARNGQVAGQILKFTNNTMTSIGSAVAAANSAPLGGTYRVVAVVGLNGVMKLYVDGVLQWQATDTTYTLDGSTYMTTEVISGTTVFAPDAIDGTLDFTADGAQYVHLAASHAVGNVAYNFQGVWTGGNSYVQGDEVVYGQNYFVATANSTGQAPGAESAYWQVVGSYSAFLGAWSSVTTYAVGAEVTYGGNYWVAVASNSNSAPSTTNANWQVAGPTSLDVIADGQTYARSVRTNPNLVVDSNFHFGTAFWTLTSLDSFALPTNGQGGNAIKINWNDANGPVSAYIAVQPNTTYTLSATFDQNLIGPNGVLTSYLQATCSNSSKTFIQNSWAGFNTVGGVVSTLNCISATKIVGYGTYAARLAITFTTPANCAYIQVYAQAGSGATSGSFLFYCPQLELGSSSSPYVVNTPANITAGAMNPAGSVNTNVPNISMTYTSTTTSITLSWSAFTLYFMNGTSGTVIAGGLTVTGLSASTTYTLYPFIDPSNMQIGFAGGGVGSPNKCFAGASAAGAAAANIYQYIPLNSITCSTPASGSGGGGGDQFGCLHPHQWVELADGERCLAEDILPGMLMPSPNGSVPIASVRRVDRGAWARIALSDGEQLTVTLDHRFLQPDGAEVRAADLTLGTILAARDVNVRVRKLELLEERASMVSIEFAAPHLYYLNGTLSHNPKP